MAWKPIKLPESPPQKKADSDTAGDCYDCGARDGEPCRTPACGTYLEEA